MRMARKYARGKVKFFDASTGYGFISPVKGGPDVYLHARYFCGAIEDIPGELILSSEGEYPDRFPYKLAYRQPKKDELLVYEVYHKPQEKNPMAIRWAYAKDYDNAQRNIWARPRPDLVNVRIMLPGTKEEHYKPQLIWEGNSDEFSLKLDEGVPALLQKWCYVEEERATGWIRVSHPCNYHDTYMTEHLRYGQGIRLVGGGNTSHGKFIEIDGAFIHPDGSFEPLYVIDFYGVERKLRRSEFVLVY